MQTEILRFSSPAQRHQGERAMLKIALLLLIAAGLAIFTLQNLAPIALVVLGVKTLALPLAVWVIGALAAGALTSLILAGFVNVAFRSSRTPRSTTATSKPPRSPWSAVGDRSDQTPRQQNTTRASRDDWGATVRNDWNDWDGSAEPTRRSPTASKTEIRDRADEDWANWEGYETTEPRDRPPVNIPRTDFEVPQTPKTQRQSGSVYSQSYRDQGSEREPRLERKTRPEKEVYDAEYRVLIPPYSATPEPIPPPPPPTPAPTPTEAEDDDWDLGDLLDDPKPSDRP